MSNSIDKLFKAVDTFLMEKVATDCPRCNTKRTMRCYQSRLSLDGERHLYVMKAWCYCQWCHYQQVKEFTEAVIGP